ncbi:MAG: tetraacyldisaccharide 4'-kinase, partial [Deltaproteobacteria bacterium]|nr:tetraacyldisaccharide 4'-kinase [Deltaproteobacteria bacterium]
MKETVEQLEQYGIEVILGRDKSWSAKALRVLLLGLSGVYRGLVQLRLSLFRQRIMRDHDLGSMVVSIGNLTVGGTGKTPVVELFARALQERGRRVAILSRGYKSQAAPKDELPPGEEEAPRVVSDGEDILLGSQEAGDEPYMLAVNLPGVSVVVDKNRVKGGGYALRHLDADTFILDDGL